MSVKPRSDDIVIDEEVDPVSEALDRLDTKLYRVEQGIIRPLQPKHQMTLDEWEAITYLVEEWTFFYEPETELIEAAHKYEEIRNKRVEEVYTWEG